MESDKPLPIDDPIKLSDLLDQVPADPVPVQENIQETVSIEMLKLDIQEKKDIMEMRREWSGVFKLIVILILSFEVYLTFLVGMKIVEFKDEWFLRIVILGGFAQLLGMPYTVATFLFNKDSKLSNNRK